MADTPVNASGAPRERDPEADWAAFVASRERAGLPPDLDADTARDVVAILLRPAGSRPPVRR